MGLLSELKRVKFTVRFLPAKALMFTKLLVRVKMKMRLLLNPCFRVFTDLLTTRTYSVA